MTALAVENVAFAYERDRLVLQDVSFEIKPGTFLAVVGPNGAGKSTLIGLLSGQIKPASGHIRLDKVDIRSFRARELARRIAVVRQEFVPAFGFSVAETVMMARTSFYDAMGFDSPTDRQIVADALERTDTAAFASRALAQLSGGERQRVFIARALAQETPVLLLDEPTSFLDFKHQVGIYDLLKTVQRDKGTTIVAVTHDINLAAQYCDQVLLLARCPDAGAVPFGGNCRIGPPETVLTTAALEKAFGVSVFSARMGQGNIFLPLGKMARDADRATFQDGATTETESP